MLFNFRFPEKLKMEIHIIMANYDKLNANIQILSDKVDALLVKANAPVVVPDPVIIPAPDEQPAVDAADAAVQAVIAKIP